MRTSTTERFAFRRRSAAAGSILQGPTKRHKAMHDARPLPPLQCTYTRPPPASQCSCTRAQPKRRSSSDGGKVSVVGSRTSLIPAFSYAPAGPMHSSVMFTTSRTPCDSNMGTWTARGRPPMQRFTLMSVTITPCPSLKKGHGRNRGQRTSSTRRLSMRSGGLKNILMATFPPGQVDPGACRLTMDASSSLVVGKPMHEIVDADTPKALSGAASNRELHNAIAQLPEKE
mmetsp:Transcript_4220/g.11920  ORF Transcript_4220/g.11920 Transcript_4220/m.11920 type:complete len:229 (+) Transcript_4220:465-1151(+)